MIDILIIQIFLCGQIAWTHIKMGSKLINKEVFIKIARPNGIGNPSLQKGPMLFCHKLNQY